mgnify:CR=1 FL=1
MAKIKVAIAGVGNCASSLIQGIAYYAVQDPATVTGLMPVSYTHLTLPTICSV